MNKKTGLTIIEVVIAMVVMSMLMVVIYSLFSAGMRSTKKGSEILSSVRDFNIIGERMRKDARSLLVDQDRPVLINGSGNELEMSVIEGVTSEGIPVVNKVVYKLQTGSRTLDDGTPLGSLVRVYAAGSSNERRKKYFVDELTSLGFKKFARDGSELGGSDTTIPCFLQVEISDSRGKAFSARLHLYSRYSRYREQLTVENYWLRNHMVRPLPPTFLVISDFSSSVQEAECDSTRIVGGVVMDSGAMMSGNL